MTLNEITKQLLNIANEIENNTMFDNRLGAQKKRAAADLLTPICQTLTAYVMKNCTPSKSQLKLALRNFIDEVNPKYSIISVGKNNRYGHPNKEVLDNLKNTKIYRTDQDGSIMFKIKNNKLKIETYIP